ncbi:LysM peptidoglycan-binding domain-containing protein [Desulforamulus ruminis]|uniref:Peptidoglycan-binding lysin domain protein n=1 Tax=Desulforamulus ruminis (strain ATCC 23193 / DSM 2154 / NCIMB 8452 / DL) TaxID=696281 RepID=F6DTF1_DESRL|nr:LysM domain-containing protein [Desulforamulus ruminis]AEG60013.1 Peptidoglycan-binding lysin domain protein [Desulforamulus ruminis DSM 2154]
MDVYLNDFKFTPGPKQKISFSNPRVLAKLDIPGTPDYQDMGEDETILSWSGALVSENAYQDAIQLESMKDAGLPVQLLVSDCPELSKLVRIRKFDWDLVRLEYVGYTIELVAVPPPPPVYLEVVTLVEPVQTEASPPAEEKTHTVVAGDTLWAISGKYLGNPLRWREIAQLNGVKDERKLQIGTVLKIPG